MDGNVKNHKKNLGKNRFPLDHCSFNNGDIMLEWIDLVLLKYLQTIDWYIDRIEYP